MRLSEAYLNSLPEPAEVELIKEPEATEEEGLLDETTEESHEKMDGTADAF